MKTIVDNPNLYDLMYSDLYEDIKMYIKLLKNKKNILEFGAGTGRITLPLATEGHFIEAVDLSESMLSGLKNKIDGNELLSSHITPILANMCGYQSSQKFDAIIIPLTSFNYLMTEEEQIKCLSSVKNNLNENGFAIIELLSKNTFLDANKSEEFEFVKKIYDSKNSFYEYYRTTKLDLANRKISQRRLFKYYVNGIYAFEEELEWNNKFVTIEDFENLVRKVGLSIETIYGNCLLESYNIESEDVFVKIRRKSNGK